MPIDVAPAPPAGAAERMSSVRAMAEQVPMELLQAAEQLGQNHRLLSECFAGLAHGVLQVGPDGHVLHYNRRLCELLEWPPELLDSGPHIADVARFHQQRGDAPELCGLLNQPSAREVALEASRHWCQTPGGRHLEVCTKPLGNGGWVCSFSDVTAYVEAKQALVQSEERFRSLTELSSDWYWELDPQFRFVRLDGYSEREGVVPQLAVTGRTRWELGALNMSEADWDAHRATLRAHKSFRNLELTRLGPDGQPYWISVSGVPIFDAAGRFGGYRGVGQNITARKKTEQENENLAFYDSLTGLPNRRLMLNRLGKALESATRHHAQGALLFIDLDNFKSLNDSKGHDSGDALLRQVAQRLSDCVRAIDTVARMGGDEFVVMLEGLSSDPVQARDQAQAVGDKILAAFQVPFSVGGHLHGSSPSIGVTLFGDAQRSADELLKQADMAMYRSKAAGRNTLSFFDPCMQAEVSERARIENDLRVGLQQDQLVLHFQPVVDHRGALRGAEGLVRWQHPQLGLVSPAAFIAIAAQCGLILPLGQHVLRLACERLAAWAQDPSTAHLHLSINVSARQLRQADFVPQVLAALAQTGAPAGRLRLELTEAMLLNDVEESIDKMAQLKRHGVGFSLDDFGTGYSSLAYLKRLPLDQVKIDRSFVRDLLINPNDADIVCTIVMLAQWLGLDVVAEGVETQEQREFLLANGCSAFQGYLFGPPGTEAELLAWVQATESSAA